MRASSAPKSNALSWGWTYATITPTIQRRAAARDPPYCGQFDAVILLIDFFDSDFYDIFLSECACVILTLPWMTFRDVYISMSLLLLFEISTFIFRYFGLFVDIDFFVSRFRCFYFFVLKSRSFETSKMSKHQNSEMLKCLFRATVILFMWCYFPVRIFIWALY